MGQDYSVVVLHLRPLLTALPDHSYMICKAVVFMEVASAMGRLLFCLLSVISAMCSQYC